MSIKEEILTKLAERDDNESLHNLKSKCHKLMGLEMEKIKPQEVIIKRVFANKKF